MRPLLFLWLLCRCAQAQDIYLPPCYEGNTLFVPTITLSNLTEKILYVTPDCNTYLTNKVIPVEEGTAKITLFIDVKKTKTPIRLITEKSEHPAAGEYPRKYLLHLTLVSDPYKVAIHGNHFEVENFTNTPFEVEVTHGIIGLENRSGKRILGEFTDGAILQIRGLPQIRLNKKKQ